MKPRKRHLTAQIKPATRNAILDQLAGIADGIIRDRERAAEFDEEMTDARCSLWYEASRANLYLSELERPLWRRLLGLR